MQVQVHFTFQSEEEFATFSAKFAATTPVRAAKIASVPVEAAADIKQDGTAKHDTPVAAAQAQKETAKPKKQTLNQKLAAKEVEIPEPTPLEAAIESAKEESDEVEVDASDEEVTFDNVKDAVLGVSRVHGRDAAVAVLAQFGATKVGPQIKEEDYAAVVAACKAVKKAA